MDGVTAISLRDKDDKDVQVDSFHFQQPMPEVSPSCELLLMAFAKPGEGISEELKDAMFFAYSKFQEALLSRLRPSGEVH